MEDQADSLNKLEAMLDRVGSGEEEDLAELGDFSDQVAMDKLLDKIIA